MSELVHYVTVWDGGRAYLEAIEEGENPDDAKAKRIDNIQHSLGALIKGVLAVVNGYPSKVYFDQIKDKFGLRSEDDLNSLDIALGVRKEINDEMNATKSAERIKVVRNVITALYATGYHGTDRNFLVEESDFPKSMHELFRAARDKIKDDFTELSKDMRVMDEHNSTRGLRPQPVRMRLFNEDSHATEKYLDFEMPFFKNPETKDFYYSLYTTGISAGIMYGTRSKKRIKKIRNIPLDDEIVARSVGIAVSEYAGVSIKGLAEYLNEQEHQRRAFLKIRDTPHPQNGDHVFWKETLLGRKVQSMEGTVFSEQELVDLLEAFDPEKSPHAKLAVHLDNLKEHLGRKKIAQKLKLVFNRPVADVVLRRTMTRGASRGAVAAITTGLFGATGLLGVPIDAIIDALLWVYFFYGYSGVIKGVIAQTRVLNELIPLIDNFMFQNHIEDREQIVERMFAIIPRITNLKTQFLIEALDDVLAQQPLPVKFDQRLRELRRYLKAVIPKRSISKLASKGKKILRELIEKGVLEEVSSSEVRVKSDVDQNEGVIRKIVEKYVSKDKVEDVLENLLNILKTPVDESSDGPPVNDLRGNESMISDPGGIDLNSNNLDLQESGQDFQFNLNNGLFQDINPAHVIGIHPIIVNISRVT